MSRKSGKPPRKNPFLDNNRDTLLDELNSIQDLLGEDDNKGVHPADLEDELPVLQPEADDTGDEQGDGHTQIPLLQPDAAATGDDANQRLRKALSERENPFLAQAKKAAAAANKEVDIPSLTRDNPFLKDKPPADTERAPAADERQTTPTDLDDATLRAMVDEVLAAWLPKIERELRDRLMEHLRSAGRSTPDA